MTDDDFRDLIYVVRAIDRTYELNYGAFRHSAELDNARKVFARLFGKYFDGATPGGYPQHEPWLASEDQPVAEVVAKFAVDGAEESATIARWMNKDNPR